MEDLCQGYFKNEVFAPLPTHKEYDRVALLSYMYSFAYKAVLLYLYCLAYP